MFNNPSLLVLPIPDCSIRIVQVKTLNRTFHCSTAVCDMTKDSSFSNTYVVIRTYILAKCQHNILQLHFFALCYYHSSRPDNMLFITYITVFQVFINRFVASL